MAPKDVWIAQFAIYLTGLCANALVLVGVARFARELLATRLNQWATAVTLLSFLWSLTRSILFGRQLASIEISTRSFTWSAMILAIEVQLIFLVNLSLAAERYFTLRSSGRKSFFVSILLGWACIFVATVWAFKSSPSTNGLLPQSYLQIQVFIAASSVGFFIAALLTAFFYFITYRTTTSILAQNPNLPSLLANHSDGISESTEVGLVKMKIERQLLLQALLSGGVLILYCPMQLLFIALSASGASPIFMFNTAPLFDAFSVVVAVDTVVTPMNNNQPDRHELFLIPEGMQKVSMEKDSKIPNAATFTILKEDHTLGNLLRAQLLKNPKVLFAGYKVPHPLEHTFVLKIQTTPDTNPLEVLLLESATIMREVTDLNKKFQNQLTLHGLEGDYGGSSKMDF
ncbi:DNA-directed RNA polymerase II core subunit [Entophlyctis luteolus]|nr:DNA-directed RNA polymerase II core subunit [Entophlyctis luteolus]